jgi:hypothetical protein
LLNVIWFERHINMPLANKAILKLWYYIFNFFCFIKANFSCDCLILGLSNIYLFVYLFIYVSVSRGQKTLAFLTLLIYKNVTGCIKMLRGYMWSSGLRLPIPSICPAACGPVSFYMLRPFYCELLMLQFKYINTSCLHTYSGSHCCMETRRIFENAWCEINLLPSVRLIILSRRRSTLAV